MNAISFTLRSDSTICKITCDDRSMHVRMKMPRQPWSEASRLSIDNYDAQTLRDFDEFVQRIMGVTPLLACVAARRGDAEFDGFEIAHVSQD